MEMVKLSSKIRKFFRGDQEVVVATCDEKGVPNASIKNAAAVDDETVIWEEIYFTKTYENVKKNPKVCLVGWDKSGPTLTPEGKKISRNEAYKLIGTATVYGEDHEKTKMWRKKIAEVHLKHGIDSIGIPPPAVDEHGNVRHALIEVHIEEIYDQTPGPSAGKRIAP
jgi:predicted pyridoxine 5'-phosphate oxidase superfamily flavin-nucleotide-binding protein